MTRLDMHCSSYVVHIAGPHLSLQKKITHHIEVSQRHATKMTARHCSQPYEERLYALHVSPTSLIDQKSITFLAYMVVMQTC